MVEKTKNTKPFTLANLDYLNRAKKLWLNPEYQREAVWTRSQNQFLIDSLLHEIDIPKLYFRSAAKGKYQYEVVDGQQRLRAIFGYFADSFPLSDESDPADGYEIENLKFKQLDTSLQMKLRDTQLDVVILAGYSDEDIEEIFLRLQSGTPLNAAEKRRALPGNMRDVVADLAKHKVFKLCSFSSKRFAYEDAVAKVLHLLLSGTIVDIKTTSIRKTYEHHKSITDKHPQVLAAKKAFQFMLRAFNGHPSPRFKKFSIISLAYLTVELMETYTISEFPSEFAEAYLDFERLRAENDEKSEDKQDSRLLAYSNAARADSVADLQYRHETLREEIIRRIDELEPKDSVRQFTEHQRLAVYWRDNGKCQKCEKKCKDTAFHVDHKKPFSKGGHTTIANGQVLCPECNLKKGNRTA